MPHLTLDLETIPDPEMPEYKPRDDGDAFPPPPYWQIVCIGLLYADDNMMTKRIGFLDGSEVDMMRKLRTVIEEGKTRPHLVTFNGRRFDLPVIAARCMRHGIAMPSRFERDTVYRYSDTSHMDLADALTDHGAGRHASLDAWAKLIGMPGKLDTCGADVAQMVTDSRISEVQDYCMADVVQTHAVRLRFDFIRGRCDRAEYCDAMKSLLTAVDAHPRLVKLHGKMNLPRLYLSEGA